MLVSAVQQSDSVQHKYIYIYVIFQILFPNRLLQDTEYSSLCYIGKPISRDRSTNRSLLFICFIYSSVLSLNPNS